MQTAVAWGLAIAGGYALSVGIGYFAVGAFHTWSRNTLIRDMRAAAERRRQPDPFVDNEDTKPTATSSITGFVERAAFTPIVILWPDQAPHRLQRRRQSSSWPT
jgi:hypothetical protein